MKRIFTLLTCFLLVQIQSFAQYNTPQNYNWYFGNKAGVSFNTGTPVAITTSPMIQDEGSASVSNAAGAILFYTDGDRIWNRNNAVMAGSAAGCAGGYSTSSTTQGALIVPDLTNANRYFVFSIEEMEDFLTGDPAAVRIFYSIVDMTLNGGLGDVVPGTLATPFLNPMSEKLIAIPGNNNNIWIVTHERDTKTFKVYEMNSTGLVTTPVVSTLGYFAGTLSYGIGVIKVSPNRRMIVAQNWNDPNATGYSGTKLNGTEIYDFDPCTGKITNARTLDSTNEQYGAEFSPDSKKLYTNENVPASGLTRIAQYDVTGATAAAIRATKFSVVTDPNTTTTDLRLAMNGKIYFGSLTALPPFYLSSINSPNTAGAGCGYQNNTVTLSPMTTRWWNEGLPNVFQNVVPPDTTFMHQDTVLCFSGGSTATLTAPVGTSYYWFDGVTTQTHVVSSVGNYWVRVQTACGVIMDTFRVLPGGNPITGTPTVCVGNTTTLSNSTPGGTWSSATTSVGTVGASNGVVTGVGNGTTVITYNTGGCSATITVTVTTVAPIVGSPTVCMGGTTQLSDATAGGTWSSGSTSIATITSNTGVLYGVSPGTSVIRYTSAAGCFTTATITVSAINPIIGTTTICNGGSSTLSNATAGGTWSSGNVAVATVGAASGIVYSVSSGSAVITYTTPAGCIATTTVTVNPISPITGSSSICIGSTTQLSDATSGGTWTSSNTLVATIGTGTGLLSSLSLGATVIRYSMPTGCFATYTVSVVSVVPITGTPFVCVGGTTTLSNSAVSGTWSSGNVSIATIGTTSGVVTGIATGTAPVTYVIGGCVSTATVTVNPLPPAITGNTPTCANNTITLSNSVPGGTWSSSNPAVASVNTASGVVKGVSGGSTTITYQLPTGCYITTLVTINPLPPAITGPANICLSNTTTLNNAVPGGTWSTAGTTIATVNAASGVVTGVAVGNTVISYTLPTGCITSATVSVGPLPGAPLTEDLIYCQRDELIPPLTATGTSLQWYTTATGGMPLASAPTPPTNVAGVFTWYVCQSANGCEGPRAPLKVTVHPKAQRPLISPELPAVCEFDTMSYNYAGVVFPGIVYAWSVPENALLIGSNANQDIRVMFDSSKGHNLVTLTVGDGYEPCNVSDTVALVVNVSSPEAGFYMKPDVCIGDTVTIALTHIGPGVKDFMWNFGISGPYIMITQNSNHGGPFKVVFPDAGIHYVSLTALSDAQCPSKNVFDTVMVHALPDATIAPIQLTEGKDMVCLGDSVLLQPKEFGYQNKYWWTPEHFFKQNEIGKVWGIIEAAGPVTITVIDPFGCVGVDTVMIDAQSCCVVSFPNAFTPNGDGTNDVFRPITIGNHTIHTLVIENRFGQIVYQSDNEKDAWDGTFNGVPQDLGVYFFYFKYDCEGKTHIKKGDVTLIR